jgi:hypothetical protein
MLSHEHDLVFIHVRKAAGTSIKRSLSAQNPWYNYLQDGLLDPHWPEFAPYRDRYTVFTVVRDPWDRFVSAWRYLDSTKHRPIEDVLRNLPSPDGDYDERHDYRHLARLQTDLFVDDGGEWVTDRVLRFEHLVEDWTDLFADLGMPAPTLQHWMATERASGYRDFFSREARDLFEAHFARDIDLLGYSF